MYGQLASQGAWSWGGSDQEHQHCSSWGSHPESSDFQAFQKAWMPPHPATPSILTRRRPRGRARVRIWTRGMDRVARARGEGHER